jgi:hypothetical protein
MSRDAVNGERTILLPALDRAFITAEIRGNFFPRIQPNALRLARVSRRLSIDSVTQAEITYVV